MNSSITLEAEVDLINIWMSGHSDGVSRNALGFPEPGSCWFIIDSAWFRSWQTLTGMVDDCRSYIKPIDNSELIYQTDTWDTEQPVLRPDATEMKSFVVVPPKVWQFLARNYGYLQGSCLQRYSIETGKGTSEVEAHLKRLNIAAIAEFQVQKAPLICNFSRKASVSDVCSSLARLGNLRWKAYRLWRLDQSFDKLEADMAELQMSNSADVLKFPGVPLANDLLIGGLNTDAVYVLELAEVAWTFELEVAPCVICKAEAARLSCQCGLTICCSVTCMQQTACCSEEHKSELDVNEPTNYEDNDVPVSSLAKSFGLVGLRNLGATCYMNAGLQCLSHTRYLTDFFLEDRYLADKNPGNPLGCGGLLAEEYAEVLKQLWYSSAQAVVPTQFKRCLGEFASQFHGSQQHDCHEFLSFILDGLHEDLNRVIKKPYVEQSHDQGDDEAAALLAWSAHLDRNSSVIVDLMHGQLYSKVTCLVCHRVSNTFDPFMMLSLPIPTQRGPDVKVVYVGLEEAEPKVFHVTLDSDKTVAAALSTVEAELSLNESRMEAAILSEGSFNCFIERSLEAPECLWAYQMNLSSWHIVLETIQGSRPVSYPRVVALRIGATFQELQEQIYMSYRRTLGLGLPFGEAFETEAPYLLKLFATSSDNNDAAICSICQSNDCSSCSIPTSSEPAQALFAANSVLRILAIWPEDSDLERLGSFPGSLNTEEKPVTLIQCLHKFTESETLEGDESVYCKSCGEHCRATKTLSIYRLPQVLIIHLKRFSQDRVTAKKNSRVVDFPMSRLDLSELVIGNSPDEAVYDLYGVVNHYGEISGGHYTADVKQDGLWHTFDDSSVREGFSGEGGAGYLLFYQRLN